ncbi:MAG: hypothetical protein H0X49_17285 [Acidobacteria bacterium]|nr:hypothetical protein [Acidobacteriota bacterium]
MSKQTMRNDFFVGKQIKFQSFGVKIGIEAEKILYLKKIYRLLEKTFPGGFEKVREKEIEYRFIIKSNKTEKGERFELFRNDEKVIEDAGGEFFFQMVESEVRLTVAEFAVSKVFLHAGVVAWKNQAIIIPAKSYSGKSTLVAELVKRGAVYYSDEYAVLDAAGNVQPFPKWLSLRGIIDPDTQLECSVESIGGIAGTKTIPVGMVLIAQYKKEKKIPKRWNPRRLSSGQAMMEILPHTVPIRNKPKFVLKVLNNLTSRAIIVKTVRGEAKDFANTLLNYFKIHTD